MVSFVSVVGEYYNRTCHRKGTPAVIDVTQVGFARLSGNKPCPYRAYSIVIVRSVIATTQLPHWNKLRFA
eukprot:scaffold5254_cov118-Skeletonema_dohrnii-CCMP3373.AAC.5